MNVADSGGEMEEMLKYGSTVEKKSDENVCRLKFNVHEWKSFVQLL